jgi:hypothetical protein
VPPDMVEAYLAPVRAGEQARPPSYRPRVPGQPIQVAEGDERRDPLTAVVAGQTITWTERRLVVRSQAQAHAGETALRTRLAPAQPALASLNTRRQGQPRCPELPALRETAEALLARWRGQGLLRLH